MNRKIDTGVLTGKLDELFALSAKTKPREDNDQGVEEVIQ
jgi:hypothetical protein